VKKKNIGWEEREGGGGKGGEMTQTLYEHMNKRKKKRTLECVNMGINKIKYLLVSFINHERLETEITIPSNVVINI
jgi:hypothetical protein